MRFKDIYQSAKKPILSFEFFPPKQDTQIQVTHACMCELSSFSPGFMSVTYGAGGGTREKTRDLTSYIIENALSTGVAHLTCVDHSRDEIDEIIENLQTEGINNVLALRGDPPGGQEQFTPHPKGFSCARDLVRYLAENSSLSIAVAGYPEGHKEAISESVDLRYLSEKVSAGAEILITQLFFDCEVYLRFRDKVASIGIDVPIIAGIMPVINLTQLERFTKMCGASIPFTLYEKLNNCRKDLDAVKKIGIQWAISQSRSLLKEGVPGLHFYTLNKSTSVVAIVEVLQEEGWFG